MSDGECTGQWEPTHNRLGKRDKPVQCWVRRKINEMDILVLKDMGIKREDEYRGTVKGE